MKKWTKVAFLLAAYYSLLALEACEVTIDNCECPELEERFFDYGGITAELNTTSVPTGQGSFLEIYLRPRDVEFVAQLQQPCKPGIGLLSRAYACSCAPRGWEGDKYRIIAINIYADRPFRDGLSAEDNLNAFFRVQVPEGTNGAFVFKPIDEVAALPGFGTPDGPLSLITSELPDATGPEAAYRFTIEIEKENGEKMSVQTMAVVWE